MTALQAIDVEALDAARCQVGESPLWAPGEQALWWVDIEGHTLHRHHRPSGRSEYWAAPQRLASIALVAQGGLLGAMEDGLYHLQPLDGGELRTERLCGVMHAREGMRFNDGRCDRLGRFWVSSMVRDMSLAAADGALYRFDGRSLSQPLVRGLVTGNGLAFSPAGDRLYLSDSHPSVQRVWRYALHDDGSLGPRQDFVDMNAYPGRPDGAAVDADGGYWICGNDGGALLRFTPEGRLDRALRLPLSKPSMCAFGGAGLDELFVTSIVPARPAPGFDPALDGAVLVLRPGVCGIAEAALDLATHNAAVRADGASMFHVP